MSLDLAVCGAARCRYLYGYWQRASAGDVCGRLLWISGRYIQFLAEQAQARQDRCSRGWRFYGCWRRRTTDPIFISLVEL
jgi:hypothetical protein